MKQVNMIWAVIFLVVIAFISFSQYEVHLLNEITKNIILSQKVTIFETKRNESIEIYKRLRVQMHITENNIPLKYDSLHNELILEGKRMTDYTDSLHFYRKQLDN